MKQIIDQILKFTTIDKYHVVINNKYDCQFEKMHNIMVPVYEVFSEKVKDPNCPRVSRSANVIVTDITTDESYIGCLFIDEDMDKHRMSISLAIRTLDDENWTKIISAVSCDIK